MKVKDLIKFLETQNPEDTIVGDYDGFERELYIGKTKRWKMEEELESDNYLIFSTTDYCFNQNQILFSSEDKEPNTSHTND